jgi:undecaprenyl-diphosphatase
VTTARSSPAGRTLVLIGGPLLGALAVLIGWVLAHHGRPLDWDLTLHAAAHGHRTRGLTTAAVLVTTSAQPLAYPLAAVGGLLALRPRQWWLGALVGAAILGAGQLVRLGLLVAIGRSRPPVADWASSASGFALPSGHTTTATLGAGLLCLGLAQVLRGSRRVTAVVLAVAWAVAVGATRVYLGVHWPSDVLAGWLLGALLTVLAAGILTAAGTLRPPAGAGHASAQRRSGALAAQRT